MIQTSASSGTWVFLSSCFLLCALCVLCAKSAEPAKQLNPAAWGSDHVGKPVPEYVTGDECLFCHRTDVGPAWTKNRHHGTIREADAESSPLLAMKTSPPLKHLAAE